jgi:hypothetical protein
MATVMEGTADDFFPSNFMRSSDLRGKTVVAVIDHVETEEFENEGRKKKKPVVYFKNGGLKPLVANKTNFLLISKIAGPNVKEWPSKRIALAPELVTFKGAVTEAVRVKLPPDFSDEVDDIL